MIIENCEKAKLQKTLAAFRILASADSDGEILKFSTLQEARYMTYWKNFCIIQLVNNELNTGFRI